MKIKVKLENFFVFVSFLISFYFAYWPIFAFDFAFHDEFVLFAQGLPLPYFGHEFFSGRFLGGIIGALLQQSLTKITDLDILRFFNLILLSIMGTVSLAFLKKRSINLTQSFLVTLIVLTQPPFQSWMAWSGISFHFVSIFYSFWAAMILTKSKSFKDPVTWQSAFLLLIALMFYQPGAMFFWAVGAGIFLLNCYQHDEAQQKHHLRMTFFVGITVIGIYAVILKCVKPSFVYDASWKLYDPSQVTQNYVQKFIWFKDEVLLNSLNLWNIFPEKGLSFLAALIILSGFCLRFLRLLKENHNEGVRGKIIRDSLISAFLLIVFLVLSFLPNLAAQGNAPWYRCCAGVTALIVFLLVWAVYEWHLFWPKQWRGLVLTVFLFVFSCFGVYQAARTILLYRVLPCSMEFNQIKKQLALFPLEGGQRIHYVLNKKPVLKTRYDEFGLFNLDIPGTAYLVTTLAVQEIAREQGINVLNVTGHMEGDIFVVDFNLRPKDSVNGITCRLLISDNLTFPQEQLRPPVRILDLTGFHQEVGRIVKDLEKRI